MRVWFEIWETIRRHKLRTAITGFSVAWGIFLIVVLLSVGNGLSNGVSDQFRDDAVNSIWISGGTTMIPYQGMPRGRQIKLTNDDFDYLQEHLKGYKRICSRFDRWGSQNVTKGTKSAGFSVKGVTPHYRYIEKTQVLQGRYINENDVANTEKVALIGKPVADLFFPSSSPIGERLAVNGVSYTIVGVFFDDGGDNENRMLHIPVSTAQIAFSDLNRLSRIIVMSDETKGIEGSRELEADIRTLLSNRLKYHPQDPRAIYVNNNFENFKKYDDLIIFIKYFVGFVGIMTLIAGVVGVGNILLITVKERTKEFGIRRAIGASPFSIVSLIVLEAIFITFLSGYLGLLTGLGLVELINTYIPDMGYIQNPSVDLSLVLSALGILVLSGTFTGLLPAFRAVRVNPIEALRVEV